MFNFPVTTVVNFPDEVLAIPVTVAIDDIAVVKPLLDNNTTSDVESGASPLLNAEIIFVDGRRLPIIEQAASVMVYLDAYRHLEGFFTSRAGDVDEPEERGTVIPLFKTGPTCVTSEASIPD